MEKTVTLNMREQRRVAIIIEFEAKRVKGKDAAKLLGISLRQFRRIVATYREEGLPGIAHGNRGKEPWNKISKKTVQQVLELARGKYLDYNDSHFTEELNNGKHKIIISRATVYRIRRENGLRSPRKRRVPRHRQRRERYPQAGMLLQADGSQHDWLEGRGPWLTLIAYIDDATNEVIAAVFREEEDAAGYFLGLQDICIKRGIPAAIYADRHTIFQSPSKPTIEQELTGEQPRSQFRRLLDELGIELIHANSPQAKGRIERLFGTFQDRLVKALREAGASNAAKANQVLKTFLPQHNQRFMVEPAQSGSVYIPWNVERKIKDYFCFKHQRTVANDNTISFNGYLLQIPPGPKRRSYAKLRVDVWQHLNGQLEIRYKDQSLITLQPVTDEPLRVLKFSPTASAIAPASKIVVQDTKPKQKKSQPYKPSPDHPWRSYKFPLKGRKIA